ncbi:hypothetical protein SAMN05216326_12327 [Nitrosomonas marina]|uniref:Uncharacterized protein n=1 Tax=Nitrosomonas marina TaxID=917 RepID=A0A1I0DX14_9PROT|nr:hypothetical protein SAMN05216326_12327 [Nitrosomonas marina]
MRCLNRAGDDSISVVSGMIMAGTGLQYPNVTYPIPIQECGLKAGKTVN